MNTPSLPTKTQMYVRCVRDQGTTRLTRGKVYEVVEQDEYDYCIIYTPGRRAWYEKAYFEPVPPTYDHKEEQVRERLTQKEHTQFQCGKCGAPRPCCYHDIRT